MKNIRQFLEGLNIIEDHVPKIYVNTLDHSEFITGQFVRFEKEKDVLLIKNPESYKTVSKKFSDQGIVGRKSLGDELRIKVKNILAIHIQ